MSGPALPPQLECRKCGIANPLVYFAPVVAHGYRGTCICFDCAARRGWLDLDGNLKSGIVL